MSVYKILPDYERYCAFKLPMKDVLMKLGKEIPAVKLMHFYKHNLSLKDVWASISASFEPVEGVTANGTIPDITVWVPGTLVLSNQALEALPDITRFGELLPVETPSGQYWILNCMRQINADELNSKNITEAGQVLDVHSLQFETDEATRAGLFKSPFDGYRNLFCSDQWMNSIQKAGLAGLIFSDKLEGGFA
jgi:hypothetical protein